eukprot:TRINITY_DN19301_c1_g1_i1.p1 TRINITY_DN19301_c1_g1~~TRINITY_DN19301_c1_g1_i1.p1  ORF type:complete len:463 (+),score=37.64 TRINITY_DN19301_c1_g1_i1:175-1563(+)
MQLQRRHSCGRQLPRSSSMICRRSSCQYHLQSRYAQLIQESRVVTTEVPSSAPRFCPSNAPFDVGLLPSSAKSTSTSLLSAHAVPMGRSTRCASIVDVTRVPHLAPLSRPVAFVAAIHSEDMLSLELPPAALGLSGVLRMEPPTDPVDPEDLLSLELLVLASVEVCAVDSSVSTYTPAAEARIATNGIPLSAPRHSPSSQHFDFGFLPQVKLPASRELPQTSETSTSKPTVTSSRSENAVPTGRSARCSSVGVYRVPPSAPLLQLVAFIGETNSEEMRSFELPAVALGPSGGPRQGPSADPFDLEDLLLPLELPRAMPEMRALAGVTSPSSFEPPSEEEQELEPTDRAGAVLSLGIELQFTSFDELPNFRSTLAVERHGEFMKRDAASMRGRCSLRYQISRVDKTTLREKTDSRTDFPFSWSTYMRGSCLLRRCQRAPLSFHDARFRRADIGSDSDGRSRCS